MKNIIFLTLVSVLYSYSSFSQVQDNFVENELIIKFKENKTPNSKIALKGKKFGYSNIDALNKSINMQSLKLIGNKKLANTYVIKFNSNQNMNDLIETYENTGLFEYVEPNFIGKGHGVLQTTPNDANYYNLQWAHFNDGSFTDSFSTNDADMDTDLAWDISQGDPNLVVAILDTGFKLDHPEVAGRIWVNTDEDENFTDADSNGYIDDVNGGWDFVNDDNDPTDDNGHGTNVAGVAIATGNNSIGYAGMNWNSKIMICKVLDNDNDGFYSNWSEAIYYAVDNGADVINLSAGGNDASSTLESAINYAYANNVAVVVSAGNQNSVIQYPAKYTNAFAVGSTNPDDTRSVPFPWDIINSGSNFGPELDFVAPGNYIYGLKYDSDTNYNTYWSGTSQAAPQVAGLVSLLLSVNSSLTVDEIRTILEESSEDQVGSIGEDTVGWDQYYGHGRINAFQALTNSTLSTNLNTFEDFAVYPNPVNDVLFIKSNNKIKSANLTDALGKKVFEIKSNNGIKSINAKSLHQGLYFLSLLNEDRQSKTIKIIKQ